MKYSVNWLNELAGTTLTPKEMAGLFTRYSFEVDGLEDEVMIPEGVVVGKILEVSPHPNAEKLQLTKVTIDPDEKDILDIVCGAKNIGAGDVVPVATVGTTLSNGLTIKESVIRGEKSQGMLCAEDELGLGSDHSGILHLHADAVLGTAVSQILSKKDAMIDLSILSARGHDALSHRGIAREIRAMKGVELNPSNSLDSYNGLLNDLVAGNTRAEEVSVNIEVKDKCSRYIGVCLKNIKNGQSPEWMQERLKICGMRPVNAVVDITNYVMLELGQPLHAFSVKNITNNGKEKIEIRVRYAKEGEEMALLNGDEVVLNEEDIVIANNTEVLALAGVMGGLRSATDEETTEIFLESACFDAMSIRKSRVRHKMDTESSYRFERDIDPNMAEIGVFRAVELFREFCNADIVSVTDVYFDPVLPWAIDLDTAHVAKLLGIVVPEEKIISILESLGMRVSKLEIHNSKSKNRKEDKRGISTEFQIPNSEFRVEIPTQRRDLRTQEDLIEEIGRLYGYDRIEPKAPMVSLIGPIPDKARVFERASKDALAFAGCDEILSYSFYCDELARLFNLDVEEHFSLQNPMNPDQRFFRMNMLPNALEKVRENLRYFDTVSIFEIGNVYKKGAGGSVDGKKSLVVLNTGDRAYAILKGQIEVMMDKLRIQGAEYLPTQDMPAYFHKTRTAEVICRGKRVAIIGELSPFILRSMKIKKRTACFMADMDTLLSVISINPQYHPLPKYPFVWRDMSLSVPPRVTSEQVTRALRRSIGKYLQVSEIFDVYEKEGERSLAYHLAFGDDARTLTKDEVEEMFQKGLLGVGDLGVTLKNGE